MENDVQEIANAERCEDNPNYIPTSTRAKSYVNEADLNLTKCDKQRTTVNSHAYLITHKKPFTS